MLTTSMVLRLGGRNATGFANVLHGSASLMVTVEKLDGDFMYRLGKNSEAPLNRATSATGS